MGFFSGNDPSRQPSSTSTPAQSSSPRQSAPQTARPETPATVIGKDTTLKGDLSSDTDMLVDGRVEGKLKSVQTLIIGKTGHVKAELHAKVVSVRGTVEGNCEATGKVEITSTGKVFGNITAPSISVAEGATFRGASRMASGKKDESSNRESKHSSGSSHVKSQSGGMRRPSP